ncbi:MAG: transglycosylase SLT domain-containing protein [Betaproteobacteria bacterium]
MMLPLLALLLAACSSSVTPQPTMAPLESVSKPDLPPGGPPFLREIRDATEFYFGIPAPVPVIVAQVAQESNFNPKAVSQVGATGLMQFMPSTAKWAAEAGGFGTPSPLDPAWAIRAGTWFDRFLYDRVRSPDSVCDRWLFTLSYYNGGAGWGLKRQALSATPGMYSATSRINPGISAGNQRENEQYPMRIVYALQPKYAAHGPLVCKGER